MALVSERWVVVYRHDLQIVALQVRDESIRARICAEKRSKMRLDILATPILGARVGAGLAALKNSVASALEGSRYGSAASDGGSVGG